MPIAFSTTLSAVPVRPRRGRPRGSVKDSQARVRDRVRTVAALNELLVRVSCAVNANQFSRWFDGTMRQRHPLRPWETEESGKWRKNFAGSVALAAEAVAHLEELFPDDRYYSVVDHPRRGREIQVEYPERRSDCRQSVSELFADGPARLWQALWGHEGALLKLWDLYPMDGRTWGPNANFAEVVAELEMKLWCDSRCDAGIEAEDLGRAIALYRLERAGIAGEPADGIALYQCIRLAMAELSPWFRSLDIWDDLATYVIGIELDRVWSEPDYVSAIEAQYSAGQPFDVQGYVENPFLAMLNSVEGEPWMARHMAGLVALSSYRLKLV